MAAGAILVLRPGAARPCGRSGPARSACSSASRSRSPRARSGSVRAARKVVWDAEWVKPRGGLAGEGLYYVTSTFLGTLGAHTIALFLLTAAVLLLTGASIAGVIKATTDSFATHHARGPHRRHSAAARPPRSCPRSSRARRRASPPSRARSPRTRRRCPTCSATPRTSRSRTCATRTRRCRSSRSDRLAEDPEEDEPGVARTTPDPEDLTPQGRYRATVTDSPEFEWTLPDTAFLKRSSADANKPDTAGQERIAAQLTEALGHFGVEAKVIGMVAGPHITRYELRLAPGIKVGKVAQLKDDLAYALAASDIRILAPIPGKQAVGVEVPNARRKIVHLGDVLQETPAGWSPLTVWLGKDVAGRAIGADLAKMPHLLVAGTTGAGKSGCVNAMLASVLDPRDARTSCGSCSSTPSRSSSTTTTRSRTC